MAIALLAGCSSAPERRQEPATATAPLPPSTEMVQAGHLANYATSLQTMVQGNPTEKAELMKRARDSYEGAKAGPGALLYGLLLAVPENPQREVKVAQRVLQEAMAQDELLTPAEKALGKVELARLDSEMRLTAEVDRLVADLQQVREQLRTAAANTATLKGRQQADMDESARLRKALDEARAKLDAITRMDRNNSDRPPAPEGRNQ